jgi:hypothetical protein
MTDAENVAASARVKTVMGSVAIVIGALVIAAFVVAVSPAPVLINPNQADVDRQVNERIAARNAAQAEVAAKATKFAKATPKQKALAGTLTLSNQICQARLVNNAAAAHALYTYNDRLYGPSWFRSEGLQRYEFCQAAAMTSCVKTYGRAMCNAASEFQK